MHISRTNNWRHKCNSSPASFCKSNATPTGNQASSLHTAIRPPCSFVARNVIDSTWTRPKRAMKTRGTVVKTKNSRCSQ
uniref:Uncharacterized protein n=1 Tax=Parascaris equorum TaxID=6256 RepID=A0A914RJI9_PAREQ